MKPIVLASDDAGAPLRRVIADHLSARGIGSLDLGTDEAVRAYPAVAEDAIAHLIDGSAERVILVCGTGIGMSIAANKFPGVYAALCHDTYSARRARKSNNAQVLTMGARVVGSQLALEVVDAWLDSEFEGGGSLPKVAAVAQLEGRVRA
jgi:ribose 5-phosphate isomerase B